MIRKIIFVQFLLLILWHTLAIAQDRLPREYIPQEELVSLRSDLDFSVALDLLSEFAIKFSGKPIHDPGKRTGPIGIDIKSLPWKKAMEMILSRRGLWYVEKEHFFEIVEPKDNQATLEGTGVLKFPDGTEIDPKSRAVKIEAIFFEGDRKTLREIGINWSTFYQGEVELTADQVGALSLSEDIINLSVKVPNSLYGVDIEALLRVFDSENIGKVIAQPHIIVLEGKEGNIQVGQDFSIKQRDFAGNVTDRFYSTGTIMNVVPYILENKDKKPAIYLKIHVERSQAYPDVVSTIIKKSEANSFVQLYDGEETLIGGLYSTQKANLRKGIPLLKDLPWWFLGLRYVFGYDRQEEVQKELVIIIKASLLPDVFARAKKSRGRSSDVEFYDDPEMKIRQLRKSAYKRNEKKVEKIVRQKKATKQKIEIKQTADKPSALQGQQFIRPASSPKQQFASKSDRKYFRGKVIKLRKNLALIEWQSQIQAKQIVGNKITVLRKNGDTKKYVPIGKVKVLKVVDNMAVAQRLTQGKYACPKLQIGDRVVAFL